MSGRHLNCMPGNLGLHIHSSRASGERPLTKHWKPSLGTSHVHTLKTHNTVGDT